MPRDLVGALSEELLEIWSVSHAIVAIILGTVPGIRISTWNDRMSCEAQYNSDTSTHDMQCTRTYSNKQQPIHWDIFKVIASNFNEGEGDPTWSKATWGGHDKADRSSIPKTCSKASESRNLSVYLHLDSNIIIIASSKVTWPWSAANLNVHVRTKG